jgi:uncharacterized protein (DUF2141 family)
MRLRSERLHPISARWTRALLLLLVSISAAHSQDIADPARSANTTSTHSLSGMVVNSVTGEPIRRALVQAGSSAGGSQLSVLTDAEGRFEFPAVPASDFTASEVVITARKPGFFNELELHPESFHYDMIQLTSDTSSVVLKLLPESTIFGHVLTLKGEPVEESPVRIFEERVVDGRKRWEVRGQAVTDEDGQFHVANLVPGQYLVVTGPNLSGARRLFGRVRSTRPEGFGTMFYPGVPDLEAATPLTIAGGQQMQVDFALKPEPIFSVSGTILGLGEGVSPSLQIRSKAGEILPAPVAYFDSGKFETKLPGGGYVLQLRGQDAAGLLLASDFPLTVNADVVGISLTVSPAITLPITVTQRPGEGPPASTQQNRLLRDSQGLLSVRLVPKEKRIQLEEFQAEQNEKTRTFTVRNLTPGHYSVEITAAPPWHVSAVTSGTRDLLREDLVIVAGRRPDPVEVVLHDNGATLHGKIRAEGQAVSGNVVLFSDQMSLDRAQTAVAQNQGEFLFSGVAPGDYKILAFDSIEGLEFRNPDALSPYLSKAVAVTLQPSEVTNIGVERIPREK